jgi:predicted DNA-binding transcriptional regulator AlpA
MKMVTAREPLLVTSRQAARLLSISEKTLWSLSSPRGPIPTVRVGVRSVRYSVASLRDWVSGQQAESETN